MKLDKYEVAINDGLLGAKLLYDEKVKSKKPYAVIEFYRGCYYAHRDIVDFFNFYKKRAIKYDLKICSTSVSNNNYL